MSKIIRGLQNFFHMLIKSGIRETFLYVFYRVRNELYRIDLILKGVKVGKGNFYYGKVDVTFHGGEGKIEIGSNNNFGAFVQLKAGPHAQIIIGNNCTISRFCIFQSSSKILLEDGAQIAPFVHIVDASHYFGDEKTDLSLRQLDEVRGIKTSPVIIGRNAWVCSGSVILKGVTIGEGAVIGAGSVVTKDIPAHSVAFGAPCKVIRMKK